MRTATSYACDRDTRELGEDLAELRRIERAYRLLESRLERAAVKCHSVRACRSILDLGASLADARHDASFGSTLSLAEDAAAEARVVDIQSFRPIEFPKVAPESKIIMPMQIEACTIEGFVFPEFPKMEIVR